MVYEQTRWPGLYGFAADTDTGIIEPYTADPQRLGIEFAMFGIYEPNAQAPDDVVDRHEIFWFGDINELPDLPRNLGPGSRGLVQTGLLVQVGCCGGDWVVSDGAGRCGGRPAPCGLGGLVGQEWVRFLGKCC